MVLYYILLPLAWIVFHIGFRVECIGRENLKKVRTSGCIIAPNHVSAIDPVFVVITRFWGRRMVVFAKKELFEINVLLTWFFRWMGALCVRGTREELDVIDQTVEACRNGGTLLIFPEGTREKEGKLLQPKSGLFVIAAQAAKGEKITFMQIIIAAFVRTVSQHPEINRFILIFFHQYILIEIGGRIPLRNRIGDCRKRIRTAV